MPPISLVLLLLLAPSAAAQDGLDARNEAFLRAVDSGKRDSVSAFFPRRGDWTWTQSPEGAPPGVLSGVRRFGASETVRAISRGGPACDSFWPGTGAVGPIETVLSMRIRASGTRWRRVPGDRFVPPGSPARSPVFVQWTREDGRWVVAAFGDTYYWFPLVPSAGRSGPAPAPADTGLPEAPVFAAGQSWYESNRPLHHNGLQYVKIGPPRPMAESLLARVGHHGPVLLFAGKGATRPLNVFYVQVAPGQFQRYEAQEAYMECS